MVLFAVSLLIKFTEYYAQQLCYSLAYSSRIITNKSRLRVPVMAKPSYSTWKGKIFINSSLLR